MDDKITMNWLGLKQFWPQAKMLVKAVLLLLLLDIVISVAASFILSDSFYFEKFLAASPSEKEGLSQYKNRTSSFFNHSFPVKPDEQTGWVNQKGYNGGDGEWVTCSIGARVPTELQGTNQASEINNSDKAVFLLGSSVLGGHGFGHAYQDTPGFFLGNLGYNVFDFSTTLYSIDQSFTFYKENLYDYQPKVLIVGLHNTVEAITNQFNPFIDHDLSIPFLKPSYHWVNGEIKTALPPTKAQHNNDHSEMIRMLELHDSQFFRYKLYKSLSLLPFSDYLRQVLLKINTYYYDVDSYMDEIELQQHFMREFVALANDKNMEVIFIKFETMYDMEPPFYKRWFSDYVFMDKNTRHNEALKKTEFNIIYTSEVLSKEGKPLSEFFFDLDKLHFNSPTNKLLADTIARRIEMTTGSHH